MNTYQIIGVSLGMLMYLPLAWQLVIGDVSQNIATWSLWAVLDLIAAVSIFKQGGNWQLSGAYACGGTITTLCLLKTGKFEWSNFETMVSVIVVLCIVAWILSGPRFTTILSVLGVVLAGLPQIKDAWLHPIEMPLMVYVGYTVANAFTTRGGKEWSVEERLYPAACTVLTFFIALFTAQKFF